MARPSGSRMAGRGMWRGGREVGGVLGRGRVEEGGEEDGRAAGLETAEAAGLADESDMSLVEGSHRGDKRAAGVGGEARGVGNDVHGARVRMNQGRSHDG